MPRNRVFARRATIAPPIVAVAQSAATTVSSEQLLAGRKELIIRHGEDSYRLRLTGNNKLILTK